MVYTKDGYGVIHKFEKKEPFTDIRMKHKVVRYQKEDVFFDIPVKLKIIQGELI